MKRYLLFCGRDFEATGGWNDFIASFDTVEECEQELLKRHEMYREWFNIVDTQTGLIVKEG